MSNAYAMATMTVREEILGRNIFEVFPDNPNDPHATGERNLRDSLNRVVRDRAADTMAVQKYDIQRPAAEGGGFEERYWSPMNMPVFDDAGKVAYIIHRVEDVTEFMRLKREEGLRSQMTSELREQARRMEAEVFQRAGEIQQLNKELNLLNRELMVAKDAAEGANRAKSEFLANMSHEIRTPMTAILGYTDLMMDPRQTEPERRNCVEIIRQSGDHLLTIINDILDISKIEAGEMKIGAASRVRHAI